MSIKTNRLLIATVALVLLAIAPATTKADPVTLTLTPLSPTIVAGGGPFTFDGELTNGVAGDPEISLLSVGFTLPPGFTASDELFLNNWPLTLAGGGTVGPMGLFTIEVDSLVAPAAYTLQFDFEYDDGSGSIIRSIQFQANVIAAAPTETIPEPTTLLLMGTALAGLAMKQRRKR